MKNILLAALSTSMAYSNETFDSVQGEIIGMSLVAIFLYIIARFNAIMNKKSKIDDKKC